MPSTIFPWYKHVEWDDIQAAPDSWVEWRGSRITKNAGRYFIALQEYAPELGIDRIREIVFPKAKDETHSVITVGLNDHLQEMRPAWVREIYEDEGNWRVLAMIAKEKETIKFTPDTADEEGSLTSMKDTTSGEDAGTL